MLGRLATRRGGRVALVTCGGAGAAPAAARAAGAARAWALRRVLAEGVAADGQRRASARRARSARRPTRVARQPGLIVVDLRLPRAARLGARPLRCAGRTRHSSVRGRGARPARGRAARRRPAVAGRSRERRAGRGRHLRPPVCASATRAAEQERPRAGRRRARRARRRARRRSSTAGQLGARSWGRRLRVSFAAPGFLLAAARPARARRRRARAPAAARAATPSASRACPTLAAIVPARVEPAPPPAAGPVPGWRCAVLAGAGQAARDGRRAPSSGRRSCSSPTCRARCRPTTSSRPGWRRRARRAERFLDQVPTRPACGSSRFSDSPQTSEPRPTTARGRAAARRPRGDGGTATGDGLEAALDSSTQGPAREAPAGRDRAALRRQGDRRPRPGRGRARGQAPASRSSPSRSAPRRRRSRRRPAAVRCRPTRRRCAGSRASRAARRSRPRRRRPAGLGLQTSARRSATKKEKREITAGFAAGGARAAGRGAASALRGPARLP